MPLYPSHVDSAPGWSSMSDTRATGMKSATGFTPCGSDGRRRVAGESPDLFIEP